MNKAWSRRSVLYFASPLAIRFAWLVILPAVFCHGPAIMAQADTLPKKIVLIAGKKSHGPVGNGIHDYPWSVKLLKVMLDQSNIASQVRVEYHLDGWPENPETLNDADTILVISDGRDGDLYEEAPQFSSQAHRDEIARQIARGCGFATFHFSTFAPDSRADDILNWTGGYFDWETDGKREWYSAIQTMDAELQPASPEHPVSRGVHPFKMKEEFYFNLRFREGDQRVHPLLIVPDLPGREPDGKIVAWAREREDGGRGFGTTCGHFYENWKQDDFRRLILNALAWTAHVEVPPAGVTARVYSHAEVTQALTGVEGTQRAVVNSEKSESAPIRALILSGEHHPGHNWQETSPALKEILERDPRLRVDISTRIEDLATSRIDEYDLLVMNYCNWKQPGLSDEAKAGFVRYLKHGGGLIIIHFANGAFHFSLPEAADSDWPEYRRICRRVWDHSNPATGHDKYGKFEVEIEPVDHPITAGMEAFPTVDELYYGQVGNAPITILASARSQVTGQNEPMAFVSDYEQARVFQTVLGHARESLLTDGTAELIRRAAPWVARRAPLPAGQISSAADARAKASLVAGKFKAGLNTKAGGVSITGRKEFGEPDFTFECWVKLADSQSYNILVAHEQKTSGTHWELFTMPGSGWLTAYLPGHSPNHVRSNFNLCDGQWYHVAMVYQAERVQLFVDGWQVATQSLKRTDLPREPGDLAIGSLVSQELGCNGVVDEVRLSKGLRTIVLPEQPWSADEQTLGLWHFDEIDAAGQSPDESSRQNTAHLFSSSASSGAPRKPIDHWGEEAVGFRWTEQDSVDNRWNQTQVGPFLASTLFLPDLPPVEKGLSIKVGDHQQAAMCFDTARLEWRAAWTGDFLKFDPARFGLIKAPAIGGELKIASDRTAGWGTDAIQFQRLTLHDQRVVLHYRVGQTEISESPCLETWKDVKAFVREMEIGPTSATFRIPVFAGKSSAKTKTIDGLSLIVFEMDMDKVIAWAVLGDSVLPLQISDQHQVSLPISSHNKPQQFKLISWMGTSSDLNQFVQLVQNIARPKSLAKLPAPPHLSWPDAITTQGVMGTETGPYALDTFTLPFRNPYGALMFTSGHDFFRDGTLAVCTVHGDVWLVSGFEDGLKRIEWKRFATGLFQPLGLKIIDDQVYVLGRDQITRLVDTNHDREADRYECVNNTYATSPGGHDYVTCLETDSHGDFCFVHATLGVVRAPSDGRPFKVIANGLRNPNGMGMGSGDIITVSPQEGHWTPASAIFEVRPGNYFGFGGPKPTPQRPLGYDPPLCWIPRLLDNSSGGQTWVTSDRWGPLTGQLLHFSYGKCRMLLALREEVEDAVQGGTVEFPLDFESGIMRGRFSPKDGQLYVSGLRGWVTSAVQDGCLQRVRFTNKPVEIPVAVKTMQNGLAITFSRALDPQTVQDVENYRIQQWNYRYTGSYGSPEFRVSHPAQEGRDEVMVHSATLLDDGCTLFLELPGLQPVMQMEIGCSLMAKDGTPFRQTIAYTINRLGAASMDRSRLHQPQSSGLLAAEEQVRLQPGLTCRFEQNGHQDVRRLRMGALTVPAGTSPSVFLQPGPFQAVADGYLKVPLAGTYRLWIEGRGHAKLILNGKAILSVQDQFDPEQVAEVQLRRGENRIEFHYQSPRQETPRFRLMWQGADFAAEPIPPTVLWSSAKDADLLLASQLRQGRDLFESHHCQNCHSLSQSQTASVLTELTSAKLRREAPNLHNAGGRMTAEWMAHWLLDPHKLRHQATMPQLFSPDEPVARQQAADIAAWLASQSSNRSGETQPASPERFSLELLQQGEQLFSEQGCFACHHFQSGTEEDEYDRLSLAFVTLKFQPGALQEFLRRPQADHPSTRMPDFQLNDQESAALAAYVNSRAQEQLPALSELSQASPPRGRELFFKRGCQNCHPPQEESSFEPRLAHGTLLHPASQGGCLDKPGRLKNDIPHFAFNTEERVSLTAFLKSGRYDALETNAPAETASRLMTSLRCSSCHSRDHVVSPRGALFLDEFDTGLLPESLPMLTWTGEKLYSSWTARFLAGEVQDKPRTWLKARMPSFPGVAKTLATGLAAEHGVEISILPHKFDPVLAKIGNKLSLKNGGLDCRQCHAVGQEKPSGDHNTQIALGINFVQVRERMRHDFFSRFVLDPPRFEVSTKMPKLATDGRTTKIRTHYDGDAARQFEALWNFIQSLEASDAGSSRPND